MKPKLHRHALCLLCVLAPSAAWSQAEMPVAPTNATPIPNEAFEWKLQPPIGFRGKYVTFGRLKIAMNVPVSSAKDQMQRLETLIENTIEMDYETISRDDKGATVSRFTYRNLKTRSVESVNGRRTNSSNAVIKTLSGVEIDIKHSANGNVLSLQGFDALNRRLQKSLQNVRKAPDFLTFSMNDFYTEKSLRNAWDFSLLRPRFPVIVGDIWRTNRSIYFNLTETSSAGTLQLTALNETRATIREKVNLLTRIDRFKVPFERTGRGILESDIILDRATGWPLEIHRTQRWTSKQTVDIPQKNKSQSLRKEIPVWISLQTRIVFRPHQ